MIKFLGITDTVIYYTIYDKFMLSRKFKLSEINFLIDFDRKNIKLTSSGTSSARIDKMLKMTLAPPGGRTEVIERHYII